MFRDGSQGFLSGSALRDYFLTVVNDEQRFCALNECNFNSVRRHRAFGDTDCRFLKSQFHNFSPLILRTNRLLSDNHFPAGAGTGQAGTDIIALSGSATLPAFARPSAHRNQSLTVAHYAGSTISGSNAPFPRAAAPCAFYLYVIT